MAQGRIDFNPVEITREAFQIVRDSALQIAFAGGIFYLLACVVVLVSRMMMTEGFLRIGDLGFTVISSLAGISVCMVTSARALGVTVPFLPSQLIHERQFWKFVLGWIIVGFLTAIPTLLGVASAVYLMPPQDSVTSFFDRALLPAAVSVGAGLIVTIIVAMRLSLMLPAIVIGEKISPLVSWQRTGPIFWKVLAASILTISLLVVLQSLVQGWSQQTQDPSLQMIASVVSTVISLVKYSAVGALYGLIMNLVVPATEETIAVAT